MEKSKRILVVDDDVGILESFDVLLGDQHEMVGAQNGYQALKKLKKQVYQLVFLDIKMPGMSGIEVLRWIKNESSDTRVVIMTALPQEECGEEDRQLGIDGYVRKPFDVREVERIVDHA